MEQRHQLEVAVGEEDARRILLALSPFQPASAQIVHGEHHLLHSPEMRLRCHTGSGLSSAGLRGSSRISTVILWLPASGSSTSGAHVWGAESSAVHT